MVSPEDIEAPFGVGEVTLDDQKLWTPYLDVQFNGRVVSLHHFNTVVRMFELDTADHVELREDGEPVKGIKMAHELIDMMVEYDYDFRWNKRIDNATEEWLAQIEASDLEAEWEQYDLEAE